MPPTLANLTASGVPEPTPLTPSDGATSRTHPIPAADTRDLTRPRRTLLLVEDDPFIRPLLVQILTKANFDVFPAEDGTGALDIYQAERSRIDGAVIDLVLPDINGTEVFAQIRHVDPHLPVVLISGFSTAQNLTLTGPARFLQKPFNPQELLGTLDQLFCG